MRNIYKYLLIAVAIAAVGLASCMYDDGIDNVRFVEGRPAQVELTFAVENDVDITTRAAQDEMYEHLVQNIYVFVFNGNQRVTTDKSFFDSEEVDANGNKVIQNYYNKVVNGNEQSHGTITFGALSGSGLKVCAIANINISNTNVTRADIGEDPKVDLDKLDAITTYSELQQMSIRLNSGNIDRGASFMMTGEVTANLLADETTEVEIPLKRADSKITFNVRAENSNYDDFTFIPNSFRVVNAPLKSYILPRVTEGGATLTADMDAATKAEDFYSVPEGEAKRFDKVGNNSGLYTFYMYENLKAPKKEITGNNYALREKEIKVNGRNQSYEYAPELATYVVITGELSYSFEEDNITKWLMADVEYVVHLGHSGIENVNDYSTLRNHHYTYNVTIKGVNDLIVEVDRDNDTATADQDNEQRPGAEGEIVMSAQRVINVDGHYDRATIQLTENEAKELHFAINTPWESGYDTNGLKTAHDILRDYKWVKFLINKEVGVAANTFAPYPGEQCYDGGKTATGTAATSAAYNGKVTNGAVTLRDIRQLSTYLNNDTNRANAMSDDDKIHITVFIDEYLYFYDPTADDMSTPEKTNYKGITDITDAKDAGLLLWKKSVNQPDRMLHIVKAGEMKYSDDYETSISRSVVTIKQRSIQTFYNVNATSLKSAWGTETINETGPLSAGSVTLPRNARTLADYPRAQQLISNGSPKWADVISSAEQYGLNGNYNNAVYSCALRNRDLDGDGTLDQNEVQWYLTSLNQLSDLWVGDPAMPSYAKLYDPQSNYDYTYTHWETGNLSVHGRHYISSTWTSTSSSASSTSLYTYWAEQYGATSTYANASSWVGLKAASVRCVRNMGIAYNKTDAPQSYYQDPTTVDVEVKDANGSVSKVKASIINLDYMNIVALRQNKDEGNPLAFAYIDAAGYNNAPYLGLMVLPDYYGNNGLNSTTTWSRAYKGESPLFSEKSICPDGWRVPNQREMQIMMRALPKDSWTYNGDPGSQLTSNGYLMLNVQNIGGTNNSIGRFYYFPYNDAVQRRVAYGFDPTATTYNENSGPSQWGRWSNTTAAVRCVKDNPNAKHSSSSDYGEGGEG